MSPLRYTMPVLASVAAVYATQCSGGTGTNALMINSAADTGQISGCATWTGDITITSNAADKISLDGVQKIDGTVYMKDAVNVTSLTGDSLQEITQNFHLDGATTLSELSFPELGTVNTIQWNALPALQQLSFAAGVKTASVVDIQNTQLNTLDGISLQVVDKFYIANNPYLAKMELDLGNITNRFVLQSNSEQLQVSLNSLVWANNMTISNVASISVPLLQSLNGSLGFYANVFESFAAPNLTKVGQQLSFVNNNKLDNVSCPLLTSVGGGFQIANNTNLGKVDGFQALKTVGGALDCNGAFTEVDLPQLGDVRGAFNLQSSGDITSTCNHFSSLKGKNNVIKGQYECASSVSSPGGAGSNPSGKKSGAGAIKASSALVLAGLAAAFCL